MKRLHLSTAAEADVEAILTYTLENWGIHQFEMYTQLLQNGFDSITSETGDPLIKSREEVFPGCYSILVGRHVIFFRMDQAKVEVIRILHQRMDFLFHLAEEEE